MIPTKIGRYEIKAELGRGGMATVYRAYDPSFDREVAVKVLPTEFLHDPDFQTRFKREVKIIAALEHPAIVPVYDVGEDEGVPYFVMRYMPGGSLTNRIEQRVFSMQDAAKIIEKLASALAYAHKKGIVHRDLKPDNILFDDNGDPHISDFGVASFSSATTDLTGNAAVGTPAYMSPEQAQGDKVDGRSDIYGLGVIIFQMLSGQQPYKADTPMGVAIKQITDPVPEILNVNPNLPKETDTVIKTAMAKKKEDRYPTAPELARAFFQAAAVPFSGSQSAAPNAAAQTVVSNSALPGSAAGERRTPNLAVMAGMGGLALLVVIGLGILFFKGKSSASASSTDANKSVATQSQAAIAPGATELPARSNPDFFTEDFNGSLSNWEHAIAGGDENAATAGVDGGFLNLALNNKNMSYYTYYTARTYDNIRINVRVQNRSGAKNIVSLICRYNADKGWYEFRIDNGGLYTILYTSWNKDKRSTSSVVIGNGGFTSVHTSKGEVNEYSAVCNDRTLSLSINGDESRPKVDNQFLLQDGYAGVGLASDNVAPVEVGIDSVEFSQP